MSNMEVFYGYYVKSDLNIEPEDTDEFYDLEKKLGFQFVKVKNQLYAFKELEKIEVYGFTLRIEPSEQNRFVALWYNGGGEIHEVVESMLKNLKYETKKTTFGELKIGAAFKSASGAWWFKRSTITGVGKEAHQGPEGCHWDYFKKNDPVEGEVEV